VPTDTEYSWPNHFRNREQLRLETREQYTEEMVGQSFMMLRQTMA